MKDNKKEKIKKILIEGVGQEGLHVARRVKNRTIQWKDCFKQNQLIYSLAMSLIFPIRYNFYYSRKIFKFLSKDDIVLNLGSGNKVIDESVINIDLFHYKNVDILGDMMSLPIRSNCADGIISEVTLEHLDHPEKAIREMNRVLKVGGYLCLSVPFLFHFHESPGDYFRWTKSGISLLLDKNNFETVEFENLGGPVGSFVLITAQVLAIIFSFNITAVYQVLTYLFLLILSPLYLFDFIFSKYQMAENAASIFLIVARKVG